MNITTKLLPLCLAAGIAAYAAGPAPHVFSAAGQAPESIQASVDAFRGILGPVNNPGPATNPNGRREINWDAVPDARSAPNELPADFFNTTSARGAVFSGPEPSWTGFQVSANQGVAPVRFDNLYPGYSNIFRVFSAQRLFLSTGSTVTDTDFFVPGTRTPAVVSAFGAVFTNVALPFTTSIELFTPEGISLGQFFVQPNPRGLSFLGVAFKERIIGRVRIVAGTAAPGVADNPEQGVNVVAMDDFLYSEPTSRCACN